MTASLVFVTLLVLISFVSCLGKDNVTDNIHVNVNVNVNTELGQKVNNMMDEMKTMRQEITRLTERLRTVEDNLSGEFYAHECLVTNLLLTSDQNSYSNSLRSYKFQKIKHLWFQGNS